jgi:hypothetical protein
MEREKLKEMEQSVLQISNALMLHASSACQKMALPETGVNYTLHNRVLECVKLSTNLLEIIGSLFSLFNESISLEGNTVDEDYYDREYAKLMEYRSSMIEAKLLLSKLNKATK